jgi:hypothetical protein
MIIRINIMQHFDESSNASLTKHVTKIVAYREFLLQIVG